MAGVEIIRYMENLTLFFHNTELQYSWMVYSGMDVSVRAATSYSSKPN